MPDRTVTNRHASARTSLARVWHRWDRAIVWLCIFAGCVVVWAVFTLLAAAIFCGVGRMMDGAQSDLFSVGCT